MAKSIDCAFDHALPTAKQRQSEVFTRADDLYDLFFAD